jgi:hypothetical protein
MTLNSLPESSALPTFFNADQGGPKDKSNEAGEPVQRKDRFFIGRSGAPKGTILELFFESLWHVCHRLTSQLH